MNQTQPSVLRELAHRLEVNSNRVDHEKISLILDLLSREIGPLLYPETAVINNDFDFESVDENIRLEIIAAQQGNVPEDHPIVDKRDSMLDMSELLLKCFMLYRSDKELNTSVKTAFQGLKSGIFNDGVMKFLFGVLYNISDIRTYISRIEKTVEDLFLGKIRAFTVSHAAEAIGLSGQTTSRSMKKDQLVDMLRKLTPEVKARIIYIKELLSDPIYQNSFQDLRTKDPIIPPPVKKTKSKSKSKVVSKKTQEEDDAKHGEDSDRIVEKDVDKDLDRDLEESLDREDFIDISEVDFEYEGH